MARSLISYWETPQATALEYDEFKDWESNPEKAGYYGSLIKQRTALGKDFETKAPGKKKKKAKV